MIREGYREDLRDLASSIAEAQNKYTVQKEHHDIEDTLDSLGLTMNRFNERDAVRVNEKDNDHEKFIRHVQQSAVQQSEGEVKGRQALRFHSFNVTLHDLDALAQKLESRQNLSGLVNNALNEWVKAVRAMDSQSTPEREMAFGRVLDLVGDCYSKIIAEAEVERAHAQTSYARWTKISYGLYGVGTLLTLVGKVYKIGGLDASD
jgi:plasmid stabilization system protein ParE